MSVYLVTGGCGFIGSHIAEAILAAGDRDGAKHEVRLLDDLSAGSLDNIASFADRVAFHKRDVRNLEAMRDLFRGVDYVFHEAALVSVFESVDKPLLNHEINITGTLNVCEAAVKAGVKRLVLASSSAVYGNDPTLPKVETMLPQPESPYGVAKITKEYIARIYSQIYRLPVVSLRYFNVFGPRQRHDSPYSGVISIFARRIKEKQSVTIFGDGGQTRDFIFVKDVAEANLRAMHAPEIVGGEVFNIGCGVETSLIQLVQTLDGIVGASTKPEFKPSRAGDIRRSYANVSRARKEIGFAPSHSVREGLEALLAAS